MGVRSDDLVFVIVGGEEVVYCFFGSLEGGKCLTPCVVIENDDAVDLQKFVDKDCVEHD